MIFWLRSASLPLLCICSQLQTRVTNWTPGTVLAPPSPRWHLSPYDRTGTWSRALHMDVTSHSFCIRVDVQTQKSLPQSRKKKLNSMWIRPDGVLHCASFKTHSDEVDEIFNIGKRASTIQLSHIMKERTLLLNNVTVLFGLWELGMSKDDSSSTPYLHPQVTLWVLLIQRF